MIKGLFNFKMDHVVSLNNISKNKLQDLYSLPTEEREQIKHSLDLLQENTDYLLRVLSVKTPLIDARKLVLSLFCVTNSIDNTLKAVTGRFNELL